MREKHPRLSKLLTGYPDDRPREQNVWRLMNALSMHRPDRFYCPVDEDDNGGSGEPGKDLFIPILCRYNHSLLKPFPLLYIHSNKTNLLYCTLIDFFMHISERILLQRSRLRWGN